MSSYREKTSSVMGLVISVLLHGIFLAGCLAIDASTLSSSPTEVKTTEIDQVADHSTTQKPKS